MLRLSRKQVRTMPSDVNSLEESARQITDLRERVRELEDQLSEANSTLDAIRHFEVDAFVIDDGRQSQVLKLDTARLWDIVDAVPVLIAYLDHNYRYRFVNHMYESWFGMRREEILGKRVADLLGESGFEKRREHFDQCLAGQQVSFEAWAWKGDEKRHTSVRYIPDLGSDGTAQGVFVLVTDTTAEKRAQTEREQLLLQEREAARRLRELADTSIKIAATQNVESVLQLVAEVARQLVGAHAAIATLVIDYGWDRATTMVSLSDKYAAFRHDSLNLRGARIYDLVCRENQAVRFSVEELAQHPAWRGVQDSQAHTQPLRGWLAAPLVSRDGRNLGLIQLTDKFEFEFTDADEAIIVQLAQMASGVIESARLYDQLRDNDRRKDEFLAMLAHELRNPLVPIRSGLDLLSRGQSTTDLVDLMRNQVHHMVRLVDDLLDVSRIMRGKVELRKEQLELNAIVRRAIESMKPLTSEHNHTLIEQLPSEPVWFYADSVRMTQVFVNLLTNAAKYTNPGGRIELTSAVDPEWVQLTVADNGIGISPQLLPRVFDLFAQADQTLARTPGGLGIGLTLVRSLVELHGGTVTAQSPGLGQGSTFTVRLPRAVPASSQTKSPKSTPAIADLRVLVVDDNVAGVKIMGLLLKQLGAEFVESACSGEQAIEVARKFHPEVVLLDIGLPQMDGYEVARRLRKMPELAPLVLVALTGYGSEEDRRRAVEAGFDAHLVKPPSVEDLLQLLSSARRRQS